MARPAAGAARARPPVRAAASVRDSKAARCRSTASFRTAASTRPPSVFRQSVVNVGDLAALEAAVTEVNPAVLAKAGLVRDEKVPVKVLGNGEIARALKVTAAKFSASAKEKIEKAGGQAVVQ